MMMNFTNIFAHVTAILHCFVQDIIWILILCELLLSSYVIKLYFQCE